MLLGFWKDKPEKSKWLRSQPVGRNHVADIIKNTFKSLGICGTGSRDHVTRHGLRGTVATVLLDSGEEDVAVQLRTGHVSLESLKWYTNLRGKTAQRQQRALFGLSDETERDVKRLKSDIQIISESASMANAQQSTLPSSTAPPGTSSAPSVTTVSSGDHSEWVFWAASHR